MKLCVERNGIAERKENKTRKGVIWYTKRSSRTISQVYVEVVSDVSETIAAFIIRS
jgi:hypothetical protein